MHAVYGVRRPDAGEIRPIPPLISAAWNTIKAEHYKRGHRGLEEAFCLLTMFAYWKAVPHSLLLLTTKPSFYVMVQTNLKIYIRR